MRIGCAEIPAGVIRASYLAKLGYLELDRTADRATKPGPLRKRRREAPEGFGIGVVAQRVLGSRAEPELDAELDRVRGLLDAVEGEVVVFRSPPDFTPSQHNRDALAGFFADHATADRFAGVERVWEAQGLWEPRTIIRVAEELGVTVACDPLAVDPTDDDLEWPLRLPGGGAYLRVRGLGAKRSLAPHQLEQLQLIADSYERAWIVVDTADPYRDALKLRASWRAGEPG